MNYQFIITNTQLQQICHQARERTAVALDTEFVRTRTYYPQLGLIQLYDGEKLSLIDPHSITEWQPFIELLNDTSVTKFLHAGSEDLEVFLNRFGTLPTPMSDTQILAAFVGYPLSCGFSKLVAELLHVDVDKSESRTDWLARPLTEKQCLYAAADVYYLLPIAQQLVKRVEALGWREATNEECESLCQRRSQVLDPELAYREIGNAWQLKPRQLACLKKLAAWRLCYARTSDIAVNFVVREENIWAVARYMPTSFYELKELGLSGSEIRYHGKTLLNLVEECGDINKMTLPAPIITLNEHQHYKKIFKELKSVIISLSEQIGLSSELLASRKQINQLLIWHWKLKENDKSPDLVSGWRKKLLADSLLNVLSAY